MYNIKYFIVFILFLFTSNHAFAQNNLVITTTLTNPKCNGSADGSVVINASGGTGPYKYQLSEAGAGGWQTGNSFPGKQAGTYPASVRDALGNTKTVYVTLTNPNGITATTTAVSASCSNSNDAIVTVVPSGGVAPYNYSWTLNSIAITSDNATSLNVSGYTTNKIMGPSGSYSVAVRDNNGCSGAVTYYNPTPITLTSTSFNKDVIVESGAASASSGTNSKLDLDGTGYVLFEKGYQSSTAGLPTNRIITSQQDSKMTFNLNSYSANNSARTVTGESSTLTFSTPTALAKLFILGTSGNGLSSYVYSVNFSDGTTYSGNLNSDTISFRDWYGSIGSDVSMNNLNRVRLDKTSTIDTKNYALYETPIILPAPYFNKLIASVTLRNTSTAVSAGNLFAVTGYKASGTSSTVGYATVGVSSPSITVSSDIDSTNNYFCIGQTVNYSVNTIHGGTTPSYKYELSLNESAYQTIFNNTTSNVFSVTPTAGTTKYSVRVTATANTDDGCLISKTSNVAIFTATQNTVTPTVAISGSTSICEGTNAMYAISNKTNSGNNPSYEWLVDGTVNSTLGTSDIANTSSLASGTHSIRVKLKSSIGCASNNPATSNVISTVVTKSPEPTVSINNQNSTLPITFGISSSSNLGSAPTYQWYLDGTAITGANASTYTTPAGLASGEYSLKVISSETCANPTTIMSNYRTIATALPIILKSFTTSAQSDGINVDWETATEINTDKFEILRKFQDSSDFKVVGMIKATNRLTGSTYKIIDKPILAGNYQYKIKNYDFDGQYQMSKVSSVFYGNGAINQSSKIFPNPFSDKLNISFYGTNAQFGSIILYGLNGTVLNSQQVQIVSGIQKFELNNLTSLPSGTYYVKIIGQNKSTLASFMVQKK